MTEAKELDPAALEAASRAGVDAGMRPAAALKSREMTHKFSDDYFAMAVSQDAAKAAIEALSTAPVALEVSDTTKRAAMELAESIWWDLHEVRQETQLTDAWYSAAECAAEQIIEFAAAIHPAPSREAVIDRASIIEECARVLDELVRKARIAMAAARKERGPSIIFHVNDVAADAYERAAAALRSHVQAEAGEAVGAALKSEEPRQ